MDEGLLPSPFSPSVHTTMAEPLPKAELLPPLPWEPPGDQSSIRDPPVVPAERQPQDGATISLDPGPWRFLEVPSIHVTPSSDGESPPCTPAPRRSGRLSSSDLDSLSQDR